MSNQPEMKERMKRRSIVLEQGINVRPVDPGETNPRKAYRRCGFFQIDGQVPRRRCLRNHGHTGAHTF